MFTLLLCALIVYQMTLCMLILFLFSNFLLWSRQCPPLRPRPSVPPQPLRGSQAQPNPAASPPHIRPPPQVTYTCICCLKYATWIILWCVMSSCDTCRDCCASHTTHYILSLVYCIPYTSYRVLYTVYLILHTVYLIPCTAYRILHTAYRMPYTGQPTSSPSGQPSSRPSGQPSGHPSQAPTNLVYLKIAVNLFQVHNM